MSHKDHDYTRRQVVKVGALTGVVGLAGCTGNLSGGNAGSNDDNIQSWPTYQYDTRNSGYVPSNAGPDGKVSEAWTQDLDIVSPPVAKNGVVYAPSGSSITALFTDGSVKWSTGYEEETDARWGSLALGNEYLFAQSLGTPGGVSIVSLEDGTILDEWGFYSEINTCHPAVVDGTVYYTQDSEHVLRASGVTDTGAVEQWRFTDELPPPETDWEALPEALQEELPVGQQNWSDVENERRREWLYGATDDEATSPIIADGTVYLASRRKSSVGRLYWKVYAVSASDGTEQWSIRFPKEPTGPVSYAVGSESDQAIEELSVGDDMVYMSWESMYSTRRSGTTSTLYALSRDDGSEKWSVEMDKPDLSTPVVGDDTVYLVNDGDPEVDDVKTATVYALSADDGSQKWSHDTSIRLGDSSFIVIGDTIYLSGTDRQFSKRGRLLALSSEDGTEHWTYEMDTPIRDSPVVVDSTIYLVDEDRVLYALR